MLEQGQVFFDEVFSPLSKYKHIGIGVSGGADSLALMLMVANWADRQNHPPKITIYCVNHGFRKEAKNECIFVQSQAKKLDLKFKILNWVGEKPKSAKQQKARNARYRLIGDHMEKNGVQILLTAHHALDQAETIMMRMANGSGIKGLGGMAEFSQVAGVKIFRPLLHVSPNILANIVKEADIEPVFDPSNIDENYERVRWRKILPSLINLGLDDKRFQKLSSRLKRADNALKQIANELFEQKVKIDGFGIASISKLDIQSQPEEIQLRLLQKILQKIGNSKKPHALSQVENLLNLMSEQAEFQKQTLHSCVIEKKEEIFFFFREFSKISQKSQTLKSQDEIIWDNRFLIKNMSKTKNFEISLASELKKKDFKKLLNSKYLKKTSQMQTAPLVRDQNNEIIMLGTFAFNDEISSKTLK